MSNEIRNFRDLDAWQASMDLVVLTYGVTDALSERERYGLCAQMRRAAVSIPSNVAEGHAFRTNFRGFRRHVRIALGSLAELETGIEIGLRLKFLKATNLKPTLAAALRTGQLLHGLLRALNTRARAAEHRSSMESTCRVRATVLRSARAVVRHSRRHRKRSSAKLGKRR